MKIVTEQASFIGEELGAFAAGLDWADVPNGVRHEAKRSLLNYFGCAAGVAHDPAIEALVRVLLPLSGQAQATLIGRSKRMDMLSAAMVNAAAANFLDYDDTHLATVIHPTAPVAAAVLALAERQKTDGKNVLLAFVLGAEIECRIGMMVSPFHYDRGWHITSTCGVFGAAAACSRLLGLDGYRTWQAIGIAASQSSGIVENLSTAAKNIGVGQAARSGLFAALMAAEGYLAAPAALEGPLGWARAMGDEPQREKTVGGLGRHWEFSKNTYKPYPSGIVFHSVIDACLKLKRDHALAADDIRTVTVRGNALLLARGNRQVRSERDARVSIHHSAAVSLLFGKAGLREFSPAAAMDDAVIGFRNRVRAVLDDTLPPGAASVEITTTGGVSFGTTVLSARGSEVFPMSDLELEDKFAELVREAGSPIVPQRVREAIWTLDRSPSISELMNAVAADGDTIRQHDRRTNNAS